MLRERQKARPDPIHAIGTALGIAQLAHAAAGMVGGIGSVGGDVGQAANAVRTEAANLAEELAMQEAKAGGGLGKVERIMEGKIDDPKYPEEIWAKMQYTKEVLTSSYYGMKAEEFTTIVIHYWQHIETGATHGFKFK